MRLTAAAGLALIVGALAGPDLRGQTPGAASQPAAPQQPPPAGRGGGRGGRGAAPVAPRAGAPVDLTGNWTAIVTEDWMWRMRTPPKDGRGRADVTSVPVNAEGRKIADAWNPADEGKCEAYGVGGLMRMPTRLRISWENDTTLKIESDAGQQTRLLHFGEPPASAAGTPQGQSRAEWLLGGRGGFDAFLERGAGPGPGGQRWGELRVVTRNMKPGWLRRNGVPYSENAVVTEHFMRLSPPDAGEWFVVTTTVEDPRYLTQPFTTSSNFKREADGSKWSPQPCRS